jgi:hypothetical protein
MSNSDAQRSGSSGVGLASVLSHLGINRDLVSFKLDNGKDHQLISPASGNGLNASGRDNSDKSDDNGASGDSLSHNGKGGNGTLEDAPADIAKLLMDPSTRTLALQRMASELGYKNYSSVHYSDSVSDSARAEISPIDGAITVYKNAFSESYSDLGSVLFHEIVHAEQYDRYGGPGSAPLLDARHSNIYHMFEYEAHFRENSRENPFFDKMSKSLLRDNTSYMNAHYQSMNTTNRMNVDSGKFDCTRTFCSGQNTRGENP